MSGYATTCSVTVQFRDYLAACSLVQEVNTNKIENFSRMRTTKEIEHFMIEKGPRQDFILDLVQTARDLPEDRQWQGTNAANILLQIDKKMLRGLNLSGCRLRRVNFRGCDSTDTDFRGADLGECFFDKNILSAKLEGVQVERSSLDLGSTGISDLSPLRELRQLKELWLHNNPLAKDQIDALKKALPELEIEK